MTRLLERLSGLIAQTGPIGVSTFMASALYDPQDGYYSRQARPGGLGIGDDFLTAPEISQMFGELIGGWAVHEWRAIGAPERCLLIEIGPGSGALMADAWRAIRADPAAAAAFEVHLVEINPWLRTAQEERLCGLPRPPQWHGALEAIGPGPSIIIANEALDCLPIRQFVQTQSGWRERLVGLRDGRLAFGLSEAPPEVPPAIPPALLASPAGAVVEIAPGLPGVVEALAARLRAAPGRALLIDYGPADSEAGDSLQAVSKHRKVDPLADPGGADLTAHVDFGAVGRLSLQAGLAVYGAIPQAVFLEALGLSARAARLKASAPERSDVIDRQHARLAGADEMGVLFKALCLTTPDLSPPAGFSPT